MRAAPHLPPPSPPSSPTLRERKGGGRPLTFPPAPSSPTRGEKGGTNRAGAILRLATLPPSPSPPAPLPLPHCGRGRGESGPHLPPCPLPLPPGARKGGRTEQGRSCGWQRYRVHDPPFSRSAGAGPGGRAAPHLPPQPPFLSHAAGEEGGRARGGAKARWHSLTQWLHGYGTCPLRKLGF